MKDNIILKSYLLFSEHFKFVYIYKFIYFNICLYTFKYLISTYMNSKIFVKIIHEFQGELQWLYGGKKGKKT